MAAPQQFSAQLFNFARKYVTWQLAARIAARFLALR